MTEKFESIEVDLTDEEFLHIAKCAHELDVTFNQMVTKILEQHIQDLRENGTHSS